MTEDHTRVTLFFVSAYMPPNYHLRAIVHINGNGLDNRWENLRPAREGELIDNKDMTYAANDAGDTFHEMIVRAAYRARNDSMAAKLRWRVYCNRAGQ